jgi:ribonuclease P protein component
VQRRFRLKRSSDFQRVRRFGRAYTHPLAVLIALPGDQEHSRFAVSAGRSVGSAVERNRAKRLLRESLRSLHREILPGWDIVILARQPMRSASFHETAQAVQTLLTRAGLLKPSDHG